MFEHPDLLRTMHEDRVRRLRALRSGEVDTRWARPRRKRTRD